jgi:hypothetical protein
VRKHRLDPFSLVLGATFSVLGALFLFVRTDIEDLHLKWIWPVPLIVLGSLIIALSVREGRPRPDSKPLPAARDVDETTEAPFHD